MVRRFNGMTPAERIQPLIVLLHHGKADPDALTDPELLAYAREEIARLRDEGGKRVLAEHDHESKIRCQALERMVRLHEAAT
jgi:hypothetical protein